MNLFQLVARSELVAHVRIRSGSLRFAIVEVQEPMKGTAPFPVLRIAFRDFNMSRGPGDDPIVFPDGQEEILFLVPHGRNARRRKDREKNRDLYTLFHGRQGRLTVPAEGPGVLIQAIRRLSEVSRLDPASQAEALDGLLGGSNPLLLQTALAEIERLQSARPRLLPRLIGLLASPAAMLRVGSLRVIARIFASGRIGDESLDGARAALAAVLERARNDPDESVRAQAVASIAVWPERQEVQRDLKAIAGTDPAQAVRYEAEKALFKP
ncbi:MAG: hypothetical protein HYS34_04280 [Acidobacteria bacterium]|nr:hypothetical protein [Acidobacteriota bacterium]